MRYVYWLYAFMTRDASFGLNMSQTCPTSIPNSVAVGGQVVRVMVGSSSRLEPSACGLLGAVLSVAWGYWIDRHREIILL